ncbi:hypothetical protein PIB30_014186 [Stylosanthes scabra]|uniref:Uncharacterized protein n=1 Tax=Stylosanthes scabra TaxID=79078 RepID=A0ABU6V4Z1_9FABA|nr:hypothetical protein [Stylosanthes scabra]
MNFRVKIFKFKKWMQDGSLSRRSAIIAFLSVSQVNREHGNSSGMKSKNQVLNIVITAAATHNLIREASTTTSHVNARRLRSKDLQNAMILSTNSMKSDLFWIHKFTESSLVTSIHWECQLLDIKLVLTASFI